MYGFGASHVGRVRLNNEDSIFVSNDAVGNLDNLYIVADGMGGHKAGQVASNAAIESFVAGIRSGEDEEPLDIMIGGVSNANNAVYTLGQAHEEYSNMGTTMIACTIKGAVLYAAHVGDSRLYRISGGKITQVTNDHSYVAEMVRAGKMTEEEALIHPQRSCITRAVGTDSSVRVDGIIVNVDSKDLFIICSDGLSNMVTKEEMLEICLDKSKSVEERVHLLIEKANEKGGPDNISAILIDLEEWQ